MRCAYRAKAALFPTGKAKMSGKVTAISSDQPGLYRFLVETGMAGKRELIITAKVQGRSIRLPTRSPLTPSDPRFALETDNIVTHARGGLVPGLGLFSWTECSVVRANLTKIRSFQA